MAVHPKCEANEIAARLGVGTHACKNGCSALISVEEGKTPEIIGGCVEESQPIPSPASSEIEAHHSWLIHGYTDEPPK